MAICCDECNDRIYESGIPEIDLGGVPDATAERVVIKTKGLTKSEYDDSLDLDLCELCATDKLIGWLTHHHDKLSALKDPTTAPTQRPG